MSKTPLLIRVPADLSAGRAADQFPLRFPDGLRADIKATAKANNRSMNAEIIARLTAIPHATPTLRDLFAMQALNGIIPDCGLSAQEMAERCFEAADAMMAHRAQAIPSKPEAA